MADSLAAQCRLDTDELPGTCLFVPVSKEIGSFPGFEKAGLNMARRPLRIFGYALFSIVVLCAAGIIALRIYVLRVEKKAERLQSEVLRLTPGVTTLAEVRRFVSGTERPEGYAGFDGPVCDESECVVFVNQSTLDIWDNPLIRPLVVFGIRPADYNAVVNVNGGIVRRVVFGSYYRRGGNRASETVVLVQKFSPDDLRSPSVSKMHPGYAACRWPQQPGVQYDHNLIVGIATDRAAERVNLNLSCVTSFRGYPNAADHFRVENTSAPDLISGSVAPECSPMQDLAWWSNWPRGKYPK
jgi:hypothetical protein